MAGSKSDVSGSDPRVFALITHKHTHTRAFLLAAFNDLTGKHQTLVISSAGQAVYTGMKQMTAL